MPTHRLVFMVDAEDGHNAHAIEYLRSLRDAFTAITDLQQWAFDGNQLATSNLIGVNHTEDD